MPLTTRSRSYQHCTDCRSSLSRMASPTSLLRGSRRDRRTSGRCLTSLMALGGSASAIQSCAFSQRYFSMLILAGVGPPVSRQLTHIDVRCANNEFLTVNEALPDATLTGHNVVGLRTGTSKRAGFPCGTITWICGTSALRDQYPSGAHTTHPGPLSSSMRPFRASSVRLRTTSSRAKCAGPLWCIPKTFASKGQCFTASGPRFEKGQWQQKAKKMGRRIEMVCPSCISITLHGTDTS